ncbi:UNVERIFIED_CONTAM: hypothetical protein FKN15_003851 [Acipenser sinensis]
MNLKQKHFGNVNNHQVIKSAQPFKVEISKTQAKFHETFGATLLSTKQMGTTAKPMRSKVAPVVSSNLYEKHKLT